MKTNYLFMAFSFATMTLASCSNEMKELLDAQDEQIVSQDSVFTYDMYFDSEITSYDGTTRATTASDWEDGDIVYIHFYGANDVIGKAEYISSSNKWRVICDKALAEVTTNYCELCFGKGVNPKYNNIDGHIYYDYMTEVYRSFNGQYTYTNSGIYINASLRPHQCWRLRFMGAVGTQIRVNGTWVYNQLHTEVGATISMQSIELIVRSDGYTDYFVGYSDSYTTSIRLINNTTGEAYTRYFDENTLKYGESGYFTIPTSSNMRGWTRTSSNFKQYVDLGLPSGTKWATCNIGATMPEELGGYYAWGETSQRMTTQWGEYLYCDGTAESCYDLGDDIAGTEYDVAHVRWGDSWRMPTKDQWNELKNQCTRSSSTQNGVAGSLYTGPNGRTLFIPSSGYWTSSKRSLSDAYDYYPGNSSLSYKIRCQPNNVRAVCQ